MGAEITAFLLIDDNTPPDAPPFTNDPSTWDLSHDLGLGGSKDYAFYAAVGGVRNATGIEPLYPWRGLPNPRGTCERLFLLEDDINVSWLSLSEIHSALAHLGYKTSDLSCYVRLVLQTMAAVENFHGADRVRLVFQILD